MVAVAYSTTYSEAEGGYGLLVLYGLFNFFFVFGVGVIIGILFGVLACSSLKVLKDMEALEPLVLLAWGYASYVVSELFHVTGIITIYAYGMVLHQYTPRLLSRTNHESFENLLATVSHVADTAVFLILGINTVKLLPKGWDTTFVLTAVVVINACRFVGVFTFGWIDNSFFRGRSNQGPIKYKDLLVMAFGGLRGAIAFSLAFVLVKDKHVCVDGSDQPVQIFQHRDLFISTTIFMVLFTVIIQGSLVPDLLDYLHTARAEEKHHSFIEKLTHTMGEHIRQGILTIKSKKSWSLAWEHAVHSVGQAVGRLATRHHSHEFGYYAEELAKGHVAHSHEAFENLHDAYWLAREQAPTLGFDVGTEEFEFFIADRLHQQMFEELEHFSKLDLPDSSNVNKHRISTLFYEPVAKPVVGHPLIAIEEEEEEQIPAPPATRLQQLTYTTEQPALSEREHGVSDNATGRSPSQLFIKNSPLLRVADTDGLRRVPRRSGEVAMRHSVVSQQSLSEGVISSGLALAFPGGDRHPSDTLSSISERTQTEPTITISPEANLGFSPDVALAPQRRARSSAPAMPIAPTDQDDIMQTRQFSHSQSEPIMSRSKLQLQDEINIGTDVLLHKTGAYMFRSRKNLKTKHSLHYKVVGRLRSLAGVGRGGAHARLFYGCSYASPVRQ